MNRVNKENIKTQKDANRRSEYGKWFDSLKSYRQLQLIDIFTENSGLSYETHRKYVLGDVDIVKVLAPAIKNILINEFGADLKLILFPTNIQNNDIHAVPIRSK